MNKLLMSVLSRFDAALFRYQVKAGFILCAVEGEENFEVENGENVEGENNEENTETNNNEENTENVENSDDEIVVSIEGEENPESEEEKQAPQWVRDLRKSHREQSKRVRELEEQLAAVKGGKSESEAVVLGEKPTLEGCGYDAEEYEQKLEQWHENRLKVEEAKTRQRREVEEQQRQWQETLKGYEKQKSELKVKGFEDAEENVKDTLSPVQQAILVKACKNSALFVYAIGSNPAKLKELSGIKDPIEFTVAVVGLEGKIKMANKRTAPPPEKTVRAGGASISGTVDSTLERLRAEAEKSGDYSKVIAYKRQLQSKK